MPKKKLSKLSRSSSKTSAKKWLKFIQFNHQFHLGVLIIAVLAILSGIVYFNNAVGLAPKVSQAVTLCGSGNRGECWVSSCQPGYEPYPKNADNGCYSLIGIRVGNCCIKTSCPNGYAWSEYYQQCEKINFPTPTPTPTPGIPPNACSHVNDGPGYYCGGNPYGNGSGGSKNYLYDCVYGKYGWYVSKQTNCGHQCVYNPSGADHC